MNWRKKATLFKILSAVPFGEALYHFVQRRVTKSLRATEGRIGVKIDVGLGYCRWLEAHGYAERLAGGTHLDFGAGWHPTVPVTLYSFGFGRQWLLDVQRGMKRDDVSETVRIFGLLAKARAEREGVRLKRTPEMPAPGTTLERMFEAMGISYEAPYEDGLWQRVENSVDLATSTQVLLHIPEPVLERCFAQISRALKRGGLFMGTVHLHPLYGGLRAGVDSYDHLTYSPAEWARFESRLMSYTRLKAPDYRRLLEGAGFSVREWNVTEGSEADLAKVNSMRIDGSFANYSKDELAARHLFFVVEKA